MVPDGRGGVGADARTAVVSAPTAGIRVVESMRVAGTSSSSPPKE
jgi:hypothetical protein